MSKQGKKQLLIIFGGFLLLILGVISYVVYQYVKDIPPPNIDDLKLTRRYIPLGENAFVYFNEGANLVSDTRHNKLIAPSDHMQGKPYDKQKMITFLQKNEPAFEKVKQGLKCKTIQFPEQKFAEDLPYLKKFRSIYRLLSEKAILECDQGKYAESIATTNTMVQFNLKTIEKAPSTINYLVSYAGICLGIKNYRKLACAPITVDQLKNIQKLLFRQEKSLDPGFIHAMKGEFNLSIGMFNDTFKGKKTSFFYKKNTSKLVCANIIRESIANSSKLYADKKTPTVDKFKKQKSYSPNPMGRILLLMITTTDSMLLKRKFALQCRFDAARLLIACKLYYRKHGKYPKKLQQLVPEFIDAVPIDPFDGKPFRYSYENKIVYSVGPDLKDSGCTKPGKPQTRIFNYAFKPRQDDLIFSIEHIKSICQQ